MVLKENQWYQLPSGRWVQAVAVGSAAGPILSAYGSSEGRYMREFDIYVAGDILGVTGLCTWETWTLADLREATPDEAEAQTHRALGLPAPKGGST